MVVTPNGAQIKIYNNPANIVEKKILPEQTYTYAYDDEYNLTHTTNADSDLSFTYDPISRLTLAQTAGAVQPATTINYSYDDNNNLLGVNFYPYLSDLYIYDSLNRVTGINDQYTGLLTNYTYDALSRRIGKTFAVSGSPFVVNYSYDLASNLLSINHERLTMNDLYTYDNVGNLTGATGSGGEATTTARSFGYDAIGRMTSAPTP